MNIIPKKAKFNECTKAKQQLKEIERINRTVKTKIKQVDKRVKEYA